MYDVITVGSALLDVSLKISDSNGFVRAQNGELCFRYGEKIHVENAAFYPGGNACNVAVGIGRLGLQTALVAELGDDEFAQKILNRLLAEPVDTTHIIQTEGEQSSFGVGIHYNGERTLFVQHVKRKHAFQFSALQTKWVYLTSLGVEWKEAYRKVLELVSASGAKLAFSPGTHQFEEDDLKGIYEVLPKTDILFVNKEEAERMSNIKCPYFAKASRGKQISNQQRENEEKIIRLLRDLQSNGAKTIVITDGRKGSFAIDRNGAMYMVEMFPGEIVGKTGAGDAYASAFLAATIIGKDIKDAMQWGSVNGAAVVEHIGAQTGLLKREELERRLNEHPKFQVQVL